MTKQGTKELSEENGADAAPVEADEKVVIAYLHPGQVDGHFCASLTELVLHDQQNGRHIVAVDGQSCGPYIHTGRNGLVAHFMVKRPEANWLLFLDADMTFGSDLLERLLAKADAETTPLVGGLYFLGWPGGFALPAMSSHLWEAGPDGRPKPTWEPGELLEVDSAGTGCLLIHRSVIESMFRMWGPLGGQWWFNWSEDHYEDVVFCMRAKSLGYRIVVDTSTVLGHVKRAILNEDDFRRSQEVIAADGTRDGILDEYHAKVKWAADKPMPMALGSR